jgi:hypothetical protein
MRKFVLCILALAAFAGLAAAETNLTGRWTGSFKVSGPDGQANDSGAVLALKQTGSDITGWAGPSDSEQHTITKGKLEGDKITLELADGDVKVKMSLVVAGDRISGDVAIDGEGRSMKGKLDVKKEK